MSSSTKTPASGHVDLETIAVTIGRMAESDYGGAERLAARFLDAAIADADALLGHRPHIRALALQLEGERFDHGALDSTPVAPSDP